MSRRSPAPSRTMAPVVGRIRKQSTFRALSRPEGRAQRGPVAVAYTRTAPEVGTSPLVGYATGRRHGGAVARNRLRRRLRAAARAAGPELAPGAYLVRAEPGAARLDFGELRLALAGAAQAAAGRARDGRAGPG